MRQFDPSLRDEHLRFGMPETEARLLSQRGVRPENVKAFYSPSLARISSPSSFGPGMSRAAEIMCECGRNGSAVGIVGDYDTDGIMSAAIIARLCKDVGAVPLPFIPRREKEGYGLNDGTVMSVSSAWSSIPLGAIFVADSGSSSNRQILELKRTFGCPVVVIDHHIPDMARFATAADAHVNWRVEGPEMCAAGECYMLARAVAELSDKVDPDRQAALAAIATVADMVPASGDNRTLVRIGLGFEMVERSQCDGLQDLCLKSCSGTISQSAVSFQIAPRINSAGRVDDPSKSLALMMTRDKARIASLMASLEAYNKMRKAIQDGMEKEAENAASESRRDGGILLYSPSWHPGICGIACSGLVSKLGVPCILFGSSNGRIKGSGRSLSGASIKSIMDACSGLFVGYGGHDMACGAELRPDKVSEASDVFDRACLEHYAVHGRPSADKRYDAEISVSQVNKKNAFKLFKTFYPYSDKDNPEPVFKIAGATAESVKLRAGDYSRFTTFRLVKDGKRTPLELMLFHGEGEPVRNGDLVDAYVSLPQIGADAEEGWDAGYEATADVVEICLANRCS